MSLLKGVGKALLSSGEALGFDCEFCIGVSALLPDCCIIWGKPICEETFLTKC